MDKDPHRTPLKAGEEKPGDPGGDQADTEWEGTGLCAEAQADGVPCLELGRLCDECGRAARTPPPPVKESEGNKK